MQRLHFLNSKIEFRKSHFLNYIFYQLQRSRVKKWTHLKTRVQNAKLLYSAIFDIGIFCSNMQRLRKIEFRKSHFLKHIFAGFSLAGSKHQCALKSEFRISNFGILNSFALLCFIRICKGYNSWTQKLSSGKAIFWTMFFTGFGLAK